MYPYQMELLFSYTARLSPPEMIGPVPEGIRVNFHVTGGEASGPRLSGRIRPVGADWFLLQPDGVGELDVRATLEAPDGALIYTRYRGLTDFGVDGYAKMLRGELPAKLSLRTAPKFSTAHPAYQWLHRRFCIGVGEVDLNALTASYDVCAID